MAAEMLMVRKPCNCKIRLSHIKQIAIADQTSIVVVVPVVSVRTDGHHYGGHLDIDRIYLSWGRTGADCATTLARQAGSQSGSRQTAAAVVMTRVLDQFLPARLVNWRHHPSLIHTFPFFFTAA